MDFKPSKALTLGVELEVQLVNEKDLSLAGVSEEIFKETSCSLVQKEFLNSMVEFVSSPGESPKEVVEELFKAVKEVAKIGKEKGFRLSASGTHPFALPEEVEITKDSRYKRLLEEFQEVLRNFLIYGLHIHVGFPDTGSLINAYNAFVEYSPIFLALSASSPFFKGRNTGIYSYRSKIFEQLPRAGVPQQFNSYEEFLELYQTLLNTKTVESLKDIWWDVRPRPDFGTVELRVCDAVASKDRIEGLLNLALMVGALSLKKRFKPYFQQVHLQNKWKAARYGLLGDYIDRGRKVKLGRKLLEVVAEYTKTFGKLKEGALLLEKLTTIPTSAEVQLKTFRSTGSLKKVVEVNLVEVES
ncbi:carboxylate-amine ligase [Thermovibrio sp.]